MLGRVHDDVPVYGSGGFTSYDDDRTREQLSGWVDKQRIPRVKIKIGESWGADERRDLDANGGYTTGQAVRVAAD